MQPQPHRLLSLGVKNKDQVAHSTCGLLYLVIELSKLGQVDRIALPYLDSNIDLPYYSRLGFIVYKKHA